MDKNVFEDIKNGGKNDVKHDFNKTFLFILKPEQMFEHPCFRHSHRVSLSTSTLKQFNYAMEGLECFTKPRHFNFFVKILVCFLHRKKRQGSAPIKPHVN